MFLITSNLLCVIKPFSMNLSWGFTYIWCEAPTKFFISFLFVTWTPKLDYLSNSKINQFHYLFCERLCEGDFCLWKIKLQAGNEITGLGCLVSSELRHGCYWGCSTFLYKLQVLLCKQMSNSDFACKNR